MDLVLRLSSLVLWLLLFSSLAPAQVVVCATAAPPPTATPTPEPTSGPTNFSGFEFAYEAEATGKFGAVDFLGSPTECETGEYCLKINSTSATSAHASCYGLDYSATGEKQTAVYNHIYFDFGFNVQTLPASGSEQILLWQNGGGSAVASLRINNNGQLSIYDSADSLVTSGETLLTPGIWFRISGHIEQGAAKHFLIKLNGAEELAGSGNFTTASPVQVCIGKAVNKSSQSILYFYDNLSLSPTGWLRADQKTKIVQLVKEGAYKTWGDGTGGSDNAEVSEIPPDNDTSYIQTNTGSGGESYTLEDNDVISASEILSVKTYARCREPSAVTSDFKLGIYTDVRYETSGLNLTTSYQNLFKIFTLNPQTESPWEISEFEAAEIVVSEHAAVNQRCTTMLVEINIIE